MSPKRNLPTMFAEDALMAARDVGVSFVVSPHSDPDLLRTSRRIAMPCVPGCLTPSEMLLATRCGAPAMKLFPAGTLGPSYLSTVREALPHLRIIHHWWGGSRRRP
jgi:2-dehydro-3-deoxyphosphogluconate aldolase/(4S)-4-hydroxy-2-oxoglutarate aldolase